MTLQLKTFLMLFILIILIVGGISIVYTKQNTASLESQLKKCSNGYGNNTFLLPRYTGDSIKEGAFTDYTRPNACLDAGN